jgi:hypothetical protein
MSVEPADATTIRVRSRVACPSHGKASHGRGKAKGTQVDANGHSCMRTNIRGDDCGQEKPCLIFVSEGNIAAKQLSVSMAGVSYSPDVDPSRSSPLITYA